MRIRLFCKKGLNYLKRLRRIEDYCCFTEDESVNRTYRIVFFDIDYRHLEKKSERHIKYDIETCRNDGNPV